MEKYGDELQKEIEKTEKRKLEDLNEWSRDRTRVVTKRENFLIISSLRGGKQSEAHRSEGWALDREIEN